MTALRAGVSTDTGKVRNINQDSYLVEGTLFAVADGMGGHVAGEVASEVSISSLRASFRGLTDRPATPEDVIDAVNGANAAVFERSSQEQELRGMGTTVTLAALVESDGEQRIAVANVGDSRAYLFSRGELTQLTEDHSVAEELVREGQLDPADVDTHPQRHILTRALGIFPEVEVDVWEVLPVVNDRIVLCSDGLVRELSDDQIASVLRRLHDPTEAAQELVARARAAGGADNITVIVVDVVEDDDLVAKASREVESSGGHATTEVEHGEATSTTGSGSTPVTFPKVRRQRRLTLRVAAFIVAVLAVLGGAAYAVHWYARDSYFVTLGRVGTATPSPLVDASSQPILIYRGRPGGLLWFSPTLAAHTSYISTEVCGVHIPELTRGHEVSSLAAANTYVANLINEAATTCPGSQAPTTTIGSTTTTRVP
jgi:serine/threonine protein phosphatase PrpC